MKDYKNVIAKERLVFAGVILVLLIITCLTAMGIKHIFDKF